MGSFLPDFSAFAAMGASGEQTLPRNAAYSESNPCPNINNLILDKILADSNICWPHSESNP